LTLPFLLLLSGCSNFYAESGPGTLAAPLYEAPLASRSSYEASAAIIRIRGKLDGKGISIPSIGVHRRSPGGIAVSSHVLTSFPV
jgi:hypothetical protein